MTMTSASPAASPTAEHGANHLAIPTLLCGLLFGLLADWLLFDYEPTPVNVLLLMSTFCGAAAWLAWRADSPHLRAQLAWSALALLCVAMLLWRSTEPLQALMLLSLLTTLSLFLLQRGGVALTHGEPQQALALAGVLIVAVLKRAPPLLQYQPLRSSANQLWTLPVLKGLLLALPALVAFSLLFTAADASFAQWLMRLQLFTPRLKWHLMTVLACGWVISGLLTLAWQRVTLPAARATPAVNAATVASLLGALCPLFMVFAGFQLANLFSTPAENVARSGLSIAEFARHGFFQLLVSAALALGLLTLLSSCATQTWYRRLASVLLGCVVIVLLAAVQRVVYYVESFGLSVDRLVACTAMLWLAACLLTFVLTVLRQRPAGFIAYAGLLGIGLSLALTVANPAALVVRGNVALAATNNRALDMFYLQSLSADAVPALLDVLPQLSDTDQCKLAVTLLDRWRERESSEPTANWRYWHAADALARRAVAANQALLQAAATGSGAIAGGALSLTTLPLPSMLLVPWQGRCR